MKKKLIVMILIVAMLPAMIFASSDILQLGLNVGYRPTIASLAEPKDDWKDYFKAEYFTFAPEVKLNLFFVDLDSTAFFSFTDQTIEIDTQFAADLYLKLFGRLKLSAGAGLNMLFLMDKKTSEWTIAGAPLNGSSFMDAVQNSFLAYRAGLGFDFGRLNMMVNYSVPTKGTFNNPDFNPEWDRGQFSVGLLVDLF